MNKHSQLYLFAKGHFDEKSEELGISKENVLKLIVLNDLITNNFIASFKEITTGRIYVLLFDIIEDYLETNNFSSKYYINSLRRWTAEESAKICFNVTHPDKQDNLYEGLIKFHLYLLRFATADELNKGGIISTEPDFSILNLWKESKEEIEEFLVSNGFEFIFIADPIILKVKKKYGVTLNSGKFKTSEIIEKIYNEQTLER